MTRISGIILGLVFGLVQVAYAETFVYEGNQIRLDASSIGIDASTSVYIDGALADSFTQLDDETLTIAVPFPSSTRTYQIELRAGVSGPVIHSANYRRATAFDLFDSYSASHTGQLSGLVSQQARPIPDPGVSFDDLSQQFDTRLSYEALAKNELISVSLSGEITGTSNGASTLRADGSEIDLTRTEFKTDFEFFNSPMQIRIGDTSYRGISELVNQGVRSRGISGTATLFNGKLKLGAGRVFGTDIVGVTQGILPGGNKNVRYGLSLESSWFDEGPVPIVIGADWLDVRRPSQASVNIAAVDDAEINRVFGLSVNAAAREGRVVYAGRWARSSYLNPSDPTNFAFVEGQVETPASKDEAWSHDLSWSSLLEDVAGQPLSFSMQGRWARIGLLYRSAAGVSAADRDEQSLNVSLNRNWLAGTVAAPSTENNVEDVPGILKTRSETVSAAANISMDALFAGQDQDGQRSVWIPESLSLSQTTENIEALNPTIIQKFSSLNGSEIPRQTSTSLSASANWTWGESNPQNLSLSWSVNKIDNKQLGRDLADNKDTRIDLSYAIAGSWWDATARLGQSLSNNFDPDARSNSKSVDFGLSTTLRPDNWPSFSVSIDQSRFRADDLIFAIKSAEDSVRYSVNVNAGDWLAQRVNFINAENPPSLSINWQRTEGDSRSEFFNQESRNESWTLNFGKAF